MTAPRDSLHEQYFVSALVANPLLLDDERVKAFAAIELAQPSVSYLVMAALRNLEATGKPITGDSVRALIAADTATKNGHNAGAGHMPDVDALLEIAQVTPPTLPALYRMIDEIRREAAARREAKRWAEELAKARADVEAKISGAAAKERAPLFVDGASLLGQEFTDEPYLVDKLITRAAVGIVGGAPKVAKTWLSTEIAIGVATGSRVCGEFFAARGTVAYFYAEDTGRQVRNRMRALLAGAGRTLPEGSLFLRPRGAFLDVLSNDDLAWIVASCRRCGRLDLLILDPLRDLHSGEENESDSMCEVMRRLRALGELLGCAVIAVHHMGKPSEANGKRGGGQRLRGSGAIHGSLDAGIYFVDGEKNSEDEWTSEIESELKGARSAGFFTLGLKVDDDERGEAIRAVWTYEREERATEPKLTKAEIKLEAKRKEEQEADGLMFEFVRELAIDGVRLTRSGLRGHDACPLTERPAMASLGRLIAANRLQMPARGADKGLVLLPEIPEQSRGDS